MNWTEWLKILKTDKLIALVIVLGSLAMLYLSEITENIDLPNTWRNVFFGSSIFCGLFLILSLIVSLSSFLKTLYANRDQKIASHEYELLEFFAKSPSQGYDINNISGVDETEKRYLIRSLVRKGMLDDTYSGEYFYLTDKGRKKILEERKRKRSRKG
ncbi:hypothetical protein [Acinetobacter lwoffii]|jgi:hypothetical protein|uniref:hypothetical protein n=1 Tax=Acinetobacter lwoffii TaxID=28090 RepID=UPI00209B0FEC|nr:hypothetical protein [Acinetobacter lwoffii]MCO8084275.1 hypothetical protein [Acinetobacter lwoffii]